MTKKKPPKPSALFTKDNLPDWFCPVPFATLIFNPWGNVGGCREQGNNHSVGDAQKQSWQEIWNGEAIRAWRREFLTGEIKTCEQHIRHRGCHKSPMNRALIPMIELSEIQSTPPKRVSPDFNGQCNLECPMCTIWKEPNGLYDELGFWEDAAKTLFPHVRQLDPLAGEPFVQKDNYRLIDLISRVNPTCEWRFTTNAHWKFTPFVREKLDKINIREMNISLDSIVEETYARVRKKGNLKTVLKTIDDILAYRNERKKAGRGFVIILNTTIQIENWREPRDFLRFAYGKDCEVVIQFLYEPIELSLLSLNQNERINILNYYLETFDDETFRVAARLLLPLLDSLDQAAKTKYSKLIPALMKT